MMGALIFAAVGILLLFAPTGPDPRTGARKSSGRRRMWFFTRGRADAAPTDLQNDARIIRQLAALLRSGMLLMQAVQSLLRLSPQDSPVAREFADMAATRKLGGSAGSCEQDPQPVALSVRRLRWCLELSSRTGAPLAQVLDQLASDLESNLVARQSFDAAMAGPKATARLLTWLPAVGLGAGFLLGIDVLGTLANSTAAQLSVAGGVVLWVLNRWWCRRLLASTTRQAQ